MCSCRLVCCLFLLSGLNFAFAGTLVQFRTVFGDMEVELYDQDKPVTVQNFLHYLQSGAYQNGFAHRLLPNFVLQGGGKGLIGIDAEDPRLRAPAQRDVLLSNVPLPWMDLKYSPTSLRDRRRTVR